MPQRNLIWLLVIPGIIGLGLAIGYSAPAPDNDYRLVRQIVETLAEVDANDRRAVLLVVGQDNAAQFLDASQGGLLVRLAILAVDGETCRKNKGQSQPGQSAHGEEPFRSAVRMQMVSGRV